MMPAASWPWWRRPAWAPWLLLPLFLPDALGHRFSPGHWAVLLAAAAALTVVGVLAERAAAHAPAGRPAAPRGALLALFAWLIFAWLVSVLSFHGFSTRYLAQDSAYFNQMMWNTVRSGGARLLEGGLFQETLYTPPVRSHFGVHVSPFLLFLAPLYALAPQLVTLLALRNLALGLGAWLLFRELRGPLGGAGATLAVAAYLAHPNTVVAASGELNEMPFAVPAVIWAVGAAVRGRALECALAAALAAAVREDAVLPVGAAALVAAVRWRKPAWAAIAAACAAWFVLCYRFVLPAFGPSGGQLVGKVYQDVGGGPLGVLVTLLTKPGVVLSMLGEPARLVYLATIARSFVGLPLFSWAALAAGPSLLTVLLLPLATYRDALGLWRHYSTLSVAVLALAGGLGAGFWLRRSRAAGAERDRLGVMLGCLLFGGALFTQVQTIGVDWLQRARPSPLAPAYRALLAAIPSQASVAAVYPMTPALSQRRHVYALRFRGLATDRNEAAIMANAAYVVADLDTLRARQVHACGPAYPAFLARLRADSAWAQVREERGLALFAHRGRVGR